MGFCEPVNRVFPSIAETLGFLPLSCLSPADLCVGFGEPGKRVFPSFAETLGFLHLSCLSSVDLCEGFGELGARPFPSTVTEDDLRLALDSLRRISSAEKKNYINTMKPDGK